MCAIFLKVTLRALLFASIAWLLSILMLKTINIDALFVCLAYFYVPADLAASLCLPISQFEKGSLPVQGVPFLFYLFAFVQWYLIFLAGILIYRHFYKTKGRDEPAA
jgi:hypothetical protein